jgi:hypothetical protein
MPYAYPIYGNVLYLGVVSIPAKYRHKKKGPGKSPFLDVQLVCQPIKRMIKTKLHPFVGNFKRTTGSTLAKINCNPPLLLVIATRKKPTPNKTPSYLLMDYPAGTGRIYLSSLYPTEQEGVYNIEYQRSRYKLSLKPDSAEIYPDPHPYFNPA